jgi:hypothetical protein
MYDVIDLCKSEEDIQNMLASIKVEHQKKKDFKDACDIFKEIDFKSAKKDDFELICSLLREFDFNGELISLLENNSHRNIRVLENKSYKKEQDIVLQLDSESSTPTFYLEGQVLVKLTEIPIDNPKTSGEKHYK